MHLLGFQTHSGYLLQTGLKRTVMVLFSYGHIRPCEGTQTKTGDWRSAELQFFVPSTRVASVLLRRSVPCTIRAPHIGLALHDPLHTQSHIASVNHAPSRSQKHPPAAHRPSHTPGVRCSSQPLSSHRKFQNGLVQIAGSQVETPGM